MALEMVFLSDDFPNQSLTIPHSLISGSIW